MTKPIDWRALYASNRAAIRRAGVPMPHDLPGGVPAPHSFQGAVRMPHDLPGGVPAPHNFKGAVRMPHDLPGGAPAPHNLQGAVRSPGHLPPLRLPAPPRAGRRPWHAPAVPGAGRRPLVHVPAGLDAATAVPLVCMLHGCTQDPASFAAATRMNAAADRHGFVVLYPHQPREANAQGCWNWFAPEHQERGRGEPAAIAEAIAELSGPEARQAIDRGRVCVAGLSSGGAMAAILAATYPDVVAAVAVHSGLAYRSATTVQAAFAAMARGGEDPSTYGPAAHAAMGSHARAVPALVVHGTADATVAPANGEQVLRQAMTANRLAAPDGWDLDPARPTETERGQVPGGHAYTRSRWRDAAGALRHERLLVHGLGHAWSGGAAGGSHTDPRGPDASEAIWRFFALAA